MPSTRRRLLIGVVIAAVVLVGGRAASMLYADYTWYDALGASPLWRERTDDLLLIYGIGSVIAVLVAFLNLSALGRSIGVLTLPRRGNTSTGSPFSSRSRSPPRSRRRFRPGRRWRWRVSASVPARAIHTSS